MSNLRFSAPIVVTVTGVEQRKRKEQDFYAQAHIELEILQLDDLTAAFEWTRQHRYTEESYQYIIYSSNGRLWRRVYRSDGSRQPSYPLSLETFLSECQGTSENPCTQLSYGANAVAKWKESDLISLPTLDALQSQLREFLYCDIDDRVADLQLSIQQYAVFGGELYEETVEPIYRVQTFGLGGNHGVGNGTHLRTVNATENDAEFLGAFPVTQLDEAIAYAGRVAARRGDTNALPMMADEPVTVHQASATKFRPYRAAPQLSQNQWLTHVNGPVCPFCLSTHTKCSDAFEIEKDSVSHGVTCRDCGHDWKNVYRLTGFAVTQD